MVLTDKQRSDLHAGIHEYLLSRGPPFAAAAEALASADPDACGDGGASSGGGGDGDGAADGGGGGAGEATTTTAPTPTKKSSQRGGGGGGGAPILEKKWTAVPRLQRRVLELERQVATNARIHAHRNASAGGVGGGVGDEGTGTTGGTQGGGRRMLPRPPCAHTLQSHSASVTSVALHPVYTMAASGSEDGTIKLWDHESGEYLRTLRGHTNVVTCVDFSPRGGYLASASTDLSVKVWDCATQEYKCVRTLRGHDHTISAVRFVPPPWGAAYLDTGRGERRQPGAEAAAGGGGAGGVDPSVAGSKFLVTASRDRTVKFWDVESGFCDHTISDHGDWVRCVAVRPALAAASSGGNDKGGGEAAAGGGGSGDDEGGGDSSSPSTSSSSRDALVATSGNDRTIYVYDAHGKRGKVCELRGHDHVVEALSFLSSSALPQRRGTGRPPAAGGATSSSNSSSWDYLASASRDRTVRLWSVASGGSPLLTFRTHENWARGVLVHPSGNHVLSCGDDRTLRVYDVKSNRCMRTIEDAHPHFVTSMAMHHTLPVMVTGGVDHTVKCWQLD